jgi:excisionase family DNA binding protein
MHISTVADTDMPELMQRLGSVSPRQACALIGCGQTRLFEMIRDGELEAFKDGSARRITLRSIVARRNRLLAEAAKSQSQQVSATAAP